MWMLFVFLYIIIIIIAILHNQLYKIVTKNTICEGTLTVLLQLIAGFSILLLFPFQYCLLISYNIIDHKTRTIKVRAYYHYGAK